MLFDYSRFYGLKEITLTDLYRSYNIFTEWNIISNVIILYI